MGSTRNSSISQKRLSQHPPTSHRAIVSSARGQRSDIRMDAHHSLFRSQSDDAGCLPIIVIKFSEGGFTLTSEEIPDDVELRVCETMLSARKMAISLEARWAIFDDDVNDSSIDQVMSLLSDAVPGIRFAILGSPADWRRHELWTKRGCQIYLSADSGMDRIIGVLRAAELYDIVATDGVYQTLRNNCRVAEASRFTKRELEVLQLLQQGYGNQDIASELYVTQNTVEFHMKNIFRKLDVRNRLEAVERCGALGLL